MKKLALACAVAAAFLLGYGVATKAYPAGGVYGRAAYHGYFTDTNDTAGTFVFANIYSGEAFPANVEGNVENFISFIHAKIASGTAQNLTGASFIVQTMIGSSRNRPPTGAELADWDARVRFAAASGWINWRANYNHTLNSFYQGNPPNDDAFFDKADNLPAIVFYNSTGAIVYALKWECANPVANNTQPLQVPNDFTMTGRTATGGGATTAIPGQAITWQHYLKNLGPTSANNIYEAPFDGPSSTPTGLSTAGGNTGSYAPGEERNVFNENFTIPSNAAAGTKYCRLIGWDPIDSDGNRNGRGVEACITVVIPAKLKAAMSASPHAMQPGDSATFTPVISATSNASPVTVNCSIARTLYSPSGTPSSLGSQPCVDSTGNANITVGSGASVTLRANNYAAADSLAIGSKICDVITITNPADPANFTNPADQSASDCVTIAKTPYVHFKGGDVWAGGGFAAIAPGTCANNANITTVTRSHALTSDGTTPGSGVTYAAFALGKITDFGSASMALVSTTGVGDAWTFSNINPANLGYFGAPQHCITDYVSTYQSSPALGAGTIDVGGGSTGSWHITGDTTMHGTMAAGLQKVYLVTGNVTVDADLKYPASYSGASQIPSLVIIATGNIYVNAGVQQMDGVFITRGTFYTCYPKAEPATISTCSNALTINGSVSATALDLFRTAGADGATAAAQKAPAETFTLQPEVYITNALNLSTQTVLTTSNVRELPPRF